jgi:hypothetical protein
VEPAPRPLPSPGRSANEAAETGWFRAANDRHNREMAAIAALGDAAPKAARRTAFRRIDKAEKAYWTRCTRPVQQSAVVVALTPVPDLPSLLAKDRRDAGAGAGRARNRRSAGAGGSGGGRVAADVVSRSCPAIQNQAKPPLISLFP